jgi:ABC-2 type transport system permease protein
MMITFLLIVKNTVTRLGDYTTDQMIVFFLTYQIIDQGSQILFRHVYSFGSAVNEGTLDFYLTKPINPLFTALFGWPDLVDVFFFIPTLSISVWLITTLSVTVTPSSIILYILFLCNGLCMSAGLHILVLSSSIFTTSIDGAIWIFRDLTRLGQFPVTIYAQPLRSILFFVVPIGVMITIPAELLLGLPDSIHWVSALGSGLFFLAGSIWVWKQALKSYTSASS